CRTVDRTPVNLPPVALHGRRGGPSSRHQARHGNIANLVGAAIPERDNRAFRCDRGGKRTAVAHAALDERLAALGAVLAVLGGAQRHVPGLILRRVWVGFPAVQPYQAESSAGRRKERSET